MSFMIKLEASEEDSEDGAKGQQVIKEEEVLEMAATQLSCLLPGCILGEGD